MARRATVINQLRQKHENVLLLDCGDVFSPKMKFPELRAETIFRFMERMEYDAMNVADGDLSLGIDYFFRLSEKTPIKLLSTTLMRSNSQEMVYEPYTVKAFGDVRVGVVGVSSSIFFQEEILSERGIVAGEEIINLKKIIPEVRRQADIVVLLSHFGYSGTLNLLRYNDINGVDVAIAGHGRNSLVAPIKINDTIVVQNSVRGEFVGFLKLKIDNALDIQEYEGKLIALTKDIPDEPWAREMAEVLDREMLDTRKKERKEDKKKAELAKQKEYLNMSPNEAMEMLKKKEEETK